MSKNSRKRKLRRERESGYRGKRPGTLMKVNGKVQPVQFNTLCDFCKEALDHMPTRVAKPIGWRWEDSQLLYDVFYCCDKQHCVESALNQLRPALEEGIIVAGDPPKTLFPRGN